MRTLLLACCLLLAAVAGCTAPADGPAPDDPDREIRYTAQNDADRPVRVVLAAAPDETSQFRVVYRDNTTETVTGANLSDIGRYVPDGTVAVVPVGPSVVTRDYTLAPGSGVGGSFTDVPRNATLVTSIGFPEGGEFRGTTIARCSPSTNLTEVTLTVQEAGNSTMSVACS